MPPVCPSPRPESFATPSPRGCGKRSEHKCDAVGDTAGGVATVGGSAPDRRKGVARVHHRGRERERLVVVETAKQACMRNAAASASDTSPAVYPSTKARTSAEGSDLPSRFAATTSRGSFTVHGRSRQTSALGRVDHRRVRHARWRTGTFDGGSRRHRRQLDPLDAQQVDELSPSSPVASAPSRSATVCPRSENEPLVPTTTGPLEAGRQERRPLARMVGGRWGRTRDRR